MTADLLQQITGIATLLTALAAFLTILELRRQRTAGYQPSLAVEDQPVALYRPSKDEYGRSVLFQTLGQQPTRESRPGGDVLFPIRNVGAGAALQVEARWEFDALEFASVIATTDGDAGRGVSVGGEFIRFEADGYASWMSRRVQEHRLGLLPASPDAPVTRVPIPFAYALLASAFFQASLDKEPEKGLELSLPPLILTLTFQDRAGGKHQNRFRVALEMEFLFQGGGPIPESPGWSNVGRGVFTIECA